MEPGLHGLACRFVIPAAQVGEHALEPQALDAGFGGAAEQQRPLR